MAPRRKLTLSIDADVIERARRYGELHATSISRLVASYLSRLPESPDRRLSPTVHQLLGILPPHASVADYRRHLEEKHLPR